MKLPKHIVKQFTADLSFLLAGVIVGFVIMLGMAFFLT